MVYFKLFLRLAGDAAGRDLISSLFNIWTFSLALFALGGVKNGQLVGRHG